VLDDELQPKKLPISVCVEDEIDLEPFRSHGLQPHEEKLADDAQRTQASGVEDENAVSQLVELGFTRHQAVYSLQKNTNNLNVAAEWLFEKAHEVPGE